MSSKLPTNEPDRPAISDREPSAVLVLLALALLLYVLYRLNGLGCHFPAVQMGRPNGLLFAYGWVLATALLTRLCPSEWSRLLLLASSAAAIPVLLGAGATVALFCYVALVCGLARSGVRLGIQIGIALLFWLSVPLARWLLWEPSWQARSIPLAIVWVSLAYSTLYLLVERHRGALATLPVTADLFYLVALPRVVEPFFQPISCRYLHATQRSHMTWRQLGRALGIGLYGAGLAYVSSVLPKLSVGNPIRRLAVTLLGTYCKGSHQIFISVALFRFLGFNIASGYRWPIVSRSFADFFRRWNHYVRDAVLYLFYFPLLGRLRRPLSRRLASIFAAYGAIFCGSFLMNDLLVPVATATNLLQGAADHLSHHLRLLLLVGYWTAIVLPKAGRRLVVPPAPVSSARRLFENGRFLLLWISSYAVVWVVGAKLGLRA